MSALRQPNFSREYYSPTPQFQPPSDRQISTAKPDRSLVNSPHPQVGKLVKSRNFRQQNKLPHNLQLLSLLQKSSFGLALISMAASTGLYMSTVQIPELWSQEYRNLEDLQRQERQLIAVNETIKYQIAQEASRDRRLAISQPDSAVFIAPTKFTSKNLVEMSSHNSASETFSDRNLGY